MSKRKSREERNISFTYKNGKKVLLEKGKEATKGAKPSLKGTSSESQKKS